MDEIEIRYFSAKWCGPCQNASFKRGLEDLKAKGWKITKYDADTDRELASASQIMAVPSFLIYRNEQLLDRFSGAMDSQRLEQRFLAAAAKGT